MSSAATHGARIRAVAAILSTVVLAAAANPAGSVAVDPEATMVQELVVTAHTGGPAWWRVSSPTTTIYILGIPETLPKHMKWDQTLLRRHLTGARELIAPPIATAGLGDIFAFMSIRKHFRSHGPMENGLRPDLRARFLADRPKANSDPRAYSGWVPLAATLLMVSDYRNRTGFDRMQPMNTVIHVADSLGVKVKHAAVYPAVPIFRAAEVDVNNAGPLCLAGALDEIEAGSDRPKIAAAGWARGDVATALTEDRSFERCINALPAGADVATRAMRDTTNAITASLGKGGRAVAMVNLRTLLARDGVLQQLRARGFTVATPDKG